VVSGLLGLVGSVVGFTFVFDISNVARVGIVNTVGHNLGTAIGKSHAVFSSSSITITVFVGTKVSVRVVISNGISVVVHSGSIISGFMVSGSRVGGFVCGSWVGSGFVSGSWVRSWLVDWGRGRVVDGSWFVSRGVVDGGSVVDRGVVDGLGRVVDRGMVDRGMMDGGMVKSHWVGSLGVLSVVEGISLGSSSGRVFLFVTVLVDLIGGGSGLRVDSGGIITMSTVD